MVDRRQVLRTAWKSYRLARPAIFAAGDTTTTRTFLRPLFGKMLRQAWTNAKKVAAPAEALVAAQARVTAAKITALPAGERSTRISQIRDELTTLDYAPLGVPTANRRRNLTAELDAFAQARGDFPPTR